MIAGTAQTLPGLFIDGFAGGGGASTGIAQAIGRNVDIAVNHSETAIAIHRANHPDTQHFCQDIRSLWPAHATKLRPVAGAWFSPDCKEYSRAKGGPVKDRHIRALSDEIEVWLKETQPTVAYLENVEEYATAGPLDEDGREIKEMRGIPFKRRVARWRRLGYRVQHRKLAACKYGAPTVRRRLYVVMRRDGLPIVWPKPTHGHPDSAEVRSGKLLPYRTAAECIDWWRKCPSIFDRSRELADATKRRIAHGVMRYVVNAARPYIVHQGEVFVPHLVTNRNSQKPFNGANEPTHTITAGGAHLNVVQASLISYGQQGGLSRAIDKPHHTVTASKKDTNGLVTAFLSSFYGSDKRGSGGDPVAPLRTVRARGQHHAVVAAHIEQANGGPRNKNSAGRSAVRPLSTVTTTGAQQRIVETTMVEEGALPPEMMDRAVKTAAFLVKYYGTDGDGEKSQIQSVDRPLDTITTRARFAVVTVTIDAKTYIIVDIGLRMLTPRELARAQGFPETYVLDPECWYRTEPSKTHPAGQMKFGPLPIAKQISAIGNSVCPPVARALVAANQPGVSEVKLAA